MIAIAASAARHSFVAVVVAAAPASAAVVDEPSIAVGDDDFGGSALAHLPALVIAFAAAWAYSCRLSAARSAAVSCFGRPVVASFQPYFVAVAVVACGDIIVAFASSLPAVDAVATEQRSFADSVAET